MNKAKVSYVIKFKQKRILKFMMCGKWLNVAKYGS